MAVKVTNLSKRELERRLKTLAEAFQRQKQEVVEKRNLGVLLAAKLYNLKPDDEIFASFTTEYKKVVVELAEGLKSGEYKVDGDGVDGAEEHVEDIMGLDSPVKGYYRVLVCNTDVEKVIKIADRRPAGEFLDNKTVIKMAVFHKLITEEDEKFIRRIAYETVQIVAG